MQNELNQNTSLTMVMERLHEWVSREYSTKPRTRGVKNFQESSMAGSSLNLIWYRWYILPQEFTVQHEKFEDRSAANFNSD